MRQPLVTVCLPTIGRTDMLREALESLRGQTYPHLEILLLDNAAEAEGRQILQDFADRDPRARILHSEERLPMFANFNRGIRAARGEYIAFLFDDDVYLPGLVQREVTMLEAYPAAGFVGSNYYLIDASGGVSASPRLVNTTRVVRGRQYIRDQVRCASMIIGTPGIMVRRDLLSTFPFDESLPVHGGDLVARLRMAEVADVGLIAEPLVQIRVHPQTETSTLSLTASVDLRARLLHDYIVEYAQRWPDDRAFRRSLEVGLAKSFVSVLLWDWIALGDNREAEERLRAFGALPAGRRLIAALEIIERLGLSARRRQSLLAPLLRRFRRIVPTPYGHKNP